MDDTAGPGFDGLVSVVVPVYNGEHTVEPCIRSLLALDFPPECLELVVVDNGSTDGTRAVLARYADRVRLFSEATRGPAAARNTGIRAARGDVIAFTDADCVVDPSWLRHLLPPLAAPDVGITGGAILAARPSNRIERFGEVIHDHRRAIEEFVPPYAITMNWASRRAVLLETGLFDEDLIRGEDVDLAYRVHADGYRLVFCPEAVVHHRNESTTLGLFREGMAHGLAMALVTAKLRHSDGALAKSNLASRIMGDARRVVLGTNGERGGRLEALCGVIFNLGKALGAARTRRRLRRGMSGRTAGRA